MEEREIRHARHRSCDDAEAADQTKSCSGSPACTSEGGAGTLKRPLKRVATLALGWVLVLGGIVALFLPVAPGGFLIVVGALMLSSQYAWLRRALEKCRVRFPVLERAFRRFSAWGESWQSRFRNKQGDSGSQFRD